MLPPKITPCVDGDTITLKRPFTKLSPSGFDYYAPAPFLDDRADTVEDQLRSPYLICENDLTLGPAHTVHVEISQLGQGRFSHWKDVGFIFSSSDGTNPQTNGRTYRAVKPAKAPPGTVLELNRSSDLFQKMNGFAHLWQAPSLDSEADSVDDPDRSPYVVYEDDQPLGPAHSEHFDIAGLGHGRFSHWRGIGFIVSSSDGTSPISNGRKYRVVLPPKITHCVDGDTITLKRPFSKFSPSGFDYYASAPGLDDHSNSLEEPSRSPYLICENDLTLGPAHTLHVDISKLGQGRFSHWKDVGFIFSSSDGINPQTNGRTYRAVKPARSEP